MKATKTETPTICTSCGADAMGCDVKAGLSGRRCCEGCTHPERKPEQEMTT